MTGRKQLLTDLHEKIQPKSVKLLVRVDSKKARLHTGRRAVQAYKFSDEKGNKMRGVSFAGNVDFIDRHLETGKYYELQNILVKPVDDRFTFFPGELQLNLTKHTQITPIDPKTTDVCFTPSYTPLCDLNSKLNRGHFDIVVVIIDVDKTREVHLAHSSSSAKVTDIYVTDNTEERIIRLSAWRELGDSCRELHSSSIGFTITTFTSVKALTYDGETTISTTMDNTVASSNESSNTTLKAWIESNKDTLTERLIAHSLKRPIKKEPTKTTLAQAMAMEVKNITDRDLFKFEAYVVPLDNTNTRTLFSCNRCGRPRTNPAQGSNACPSCPENTICTGKMFIDFTVVEDDVTYAFQAQTKQSQKLLGIDSTDFHFMTEKEKAAHLQTTNEKYKTNRVTLVVEPNSPRLKHGELKWELKYLV